MTAVIHFLSVWQHGHSYAVGRDRKIKGGPDENGERDDAGAGGMKKKSLLLNLPKDSIAYLL